MKIKNLDIKNAIGLAPMAGFCDIVMRKVADDYNCDFTVSEMVSARALYYGDKKSRQLMQTWEHKSPFGIQLFGFEPEDFAAATKIVLEHKPDFIDINMGCPAPKITTNGAGSALMRNPKLAQEIAKAVVDNANGTPVTVKMRKGWNNDYLTAVELAQRCEAVGVDLIAVHARTREEMYTPGIDLNVIKQVKQSVSIPVLGNGDIKTPQDVLNMMSYTSCDGVLIGREALSRPWIFKQVNQVLSNQTPDDEPNIEEKMKLLLWHIEKLCQVNGETLGMKKARGQAALYMKGLRGAAHLRYLTNSLTVFDDAKNLVNEVLKENSDV